MRGQAVVFAVLGVLIVAGCRAQPKPAPAPAVGWRAIGHWSGHGSAQTESFMSDTGELRVRWHTTHETSPGTGVFRLSAHSAISGRLLQLAVDRRGVGEGISFIDQDPHVFYMVVESDNLDWSFSLEEAVSGAVEGPSERRPS